MWGGRLCTVYILAISLCVGGEVVYSILAMSLCGGKVVYVLGGGSCVQYAHLARRGGPNIVSCIIE